MDYMYNTRVANQATVFHSCL